MIDPAICCCCYEENNPLLIVGGVCTNYWNKGDTLSRMLKEFNVGGPFLANFLECYIERKIEDALQDHREGPCHDD